MGHKRAGVPHVRVHGLRHTFGSQMAMSGADPFAIMKAMGHTDNKTTMIYVSLGKSHIKDQVEKLNAIQISSLSAGKTIDQSQSPRLRVASGA